MKFEVIAADPPWSYNDKSSNRGGAVRHYETMRLEDIKAMNVSEYAADDCVLLLWATFPLLPEAFAVIQAWGFTFKSVGFVWVKRSPRFWEHAAKRVVKEIARHRLIAECDERMYQAPKLASWFGDKWLSGLVSDESCFAIGQGHYVRSNAEIVLVAVRGRGASLVKDRGVRQVIDAPVREHSRKPDEFYNRTTRLFGDVNYLELFSRSGRDNWKCLGDQMDSPDFYLDEQFKIKPSLIPA